MAHHLSVLLLWAYGEAELYGAGRYVRKYMSHPMTARKQRYKGEGTEDTIYPSDLTDRSYLLVVYSSMNSSKN